MEPSFRAWSDEALLRHVIALSVQSRKEGHHPFAALVVDADGVRLALAFNASNLDRTAHAEMNALRRGGGGPPPPSPRGAPSSLPCAPAAGAGALPLARSR